MGWGGPDGYLRPVQFLDHLTVIIKVVNKICICILNFTSRIWSRIPAAVLIWYVMSALEWRPNTSGMSYAHV